MKKFIALVVLAALVIPSVAFANDFSNVEKNVGRTIACPFKAVGSVISNVGKTLTFQKPTAVLAIPKEVRQQATDMVESAGRTVVNADPIPLDELGAASTWIADNKLDPAVDFVVYGVIPAVSVHNTMEIGHGTHYLLPWKVLGWAGGGVVAADVIDNCVEK